MAKRKLVVKCDNCGKPMVIGHSKFYNRSGYCGIYCSLDCYLDAYGGEIEHGTLSLEMAKDCACEIFEDTPKEIKTVQIETGGLRKLTPEEVEKL